MTEHDHAQPEPGQDLGPEAGQDPGPAMRGRRGVLAPIASAVAVVAVATGGFAAWHFLSDPGPQPDAVLPASTVAFASVDLDPDGGQKLEALQALRKFPDLRDQVGSDTDSDLMKQLVESGLDEGGEYCQGLTWAKDFEPWIGQSVAVGGVVLGDQKPTWVVAVETSDAEKAKSALDEVVPCVADGAKAGWTVSGDYVLASDTQQHVDAIAAAGRQHPLAEDAAYQKWMGAVGEKGIASTYVARTAPEVVGKLIDDSLGDVFGAQAGADALEEFSTEPPPELAKTMTDAEKAQYRAQMERLRRKMLAQQPATPSPDTKFAETLPAQAKDFTGMAGVLRFADGGFEFSVATDSADTKAGTVGDRVAKLPADTAAVLAIATPEDLAEKLAPGTKDSSTDGLGSLGMFDPQTMATGLGLKLPDDLVTLLGSSLTVAVGGDAPADLGAVTSPAELPLGLLVSGDPQKFQELVRRVERTTGQKLSDLPATLKTSGDRIAVASSPAYADDLLGSHDLGGADAFRDVVPQADRASAVGFLQLDGAWRAALKKAAASAGKDDAQAFANLEAVRAVGLSTWQDGDVAKGLVRVSLR